MRQSMRAVVLKRGRENWQAATVISIQEHLKELNAAFRGLMPYGSDPTEEAQKKCLAGLRRLAWTH